MKKKLLMMILIFLMISGFSNLYINTVKAEETAEQSDPTVTPTPEPTITPVEPTITPAEPTVTPVEPDVSMITIYQAPSKTTYAKGEELDLTDLVVEAYYVDGTIGYVNDYEVIGYNKEQVGPQTIVVTYKNQMAAFSINVLPAKVQNITVSSHDTASFTLTWDAAANAARYEIYYLNSLTGNYELLNFVYTNSITFFYPAGTVQSYMICTVENVLGIEYKGEMSEVITAATNPEIVTGLMVTGTEARSISLSWNPVIGATGYLIYRSPATEEAYVLCGTSEAAAFTSDKLISGKSYRYKVCAYTYDETFTGDFSDIVDTSTNPAKMVLKYKAGDQKIRFSWSKINGATSYDIYVGDVVNGYTLLTSFAGNTTITYTAEGLTVGNTYSFYAIAHRDYNGMLYDSLASDLITVEINPIEATSVTGEFYATEKKFLNSWAYKKLAFFRKYVNYSKSFAIPGLITTNAGGFSSTTMCPQGITFAEGYLLVSAYDLASEENSVIYVLDKTTKELLTTLILPSKPHAGGLAYDGYNIWVTNGSKVSSIPFSDIDSAAQIRAPYMCVDYNAVCPLNIITSFITYYDGKLWVGTYNELQSTNMYSYTIENIDTLPALTKVDTIVMPTRVQGVAFTKAGTLILSRSCQLRWGLRGFMHQLDVYKPQYSQVVDGVIPLGDIVNSVIMPSMNEGIAIDSNYLYVNFESAAFENSIYRMDHICAFKLTNVVKKKA